MMCLGQACRYKAESNGQLAGKVGIRAKSPDQDLATYIPGLTPTI